MYGLWLFKELKTEYGYCKIEIFKKSYSSSPIEIEAVEANSLTLSIENLSETISPIGKSVCSFSIVDTGQLSYDDFFTPDATGIKVVISTINEDRGDVAYTTRWSGFVTPDFYSESLVYRTAINISARDNIGYLSDVEFDLIEPSIQIRELFTKAFAKISEQYPMDVMFRSHKTTEDGILLTDAVISTALFKDKTWGEVLELILHDLGLQMRWVDNNTIAVIDLSQIPEYYLPTQFQFINSSGYKEICPAWKDLSQEQDFGIRENSFEGNITSQNLRFVDIEEPITPTTGGGAGNNYYESKVAYYAPTNWQTAGDIFTTDPAYYNDANSKKIYFTAANINDVHSRYMSWRQDISKTEIPLSISFKALNSLSMPSRIFGEEGVEAPRILIPFKFNKVTISKFDGGTLQIGIIYDIFLHSGLKKYKLNYNWVDVSDGTQTAPLKFVLPEMYFSGGDDDEPPVPKEEECVITINGIPATGELEFVIYGWYFITIQDTWNETFNKGVEWEKFFAYVNEVTYTFENNSKGTGQEAKTSINPLHNILRNEKYQFGNVPKYGGGLGAYTGGLFNLVGEELSTFKRNEDSQSYNLLELVGREIIHFNKKNYNKLSGEIKSPTKEPLKFNSLFSREGKLYYPFSCSLNVIDNTMTITSMQEVEPYTTESFTEIHSEVKSDGGTTVSGGNNTVLQYSEEAGNAKRLYEMQDATPAEKEKAFALVDSPDFPQARRIRVADLIGLDEQALAQYLELNKYLQENDLTPITNRIGAVEGYFTNGSAKDALKLGGIDAGNYWHKGNSGTLDYDWKAKKLNVRTLVIPTSEPTDLLQGEVGFYLGTAGQGAEEPNGSGGLDLTELWAELGSEDYAKKIHISHIPTIQYSSIAGRPSALVNPYALTINGVVYDGSEPISLDISAGGGVADAVAWGNVFNKPTTISGYGITDAYTKDSVDLKLSNYLPKSGGILDSGSDQVPLILNSVGETTRLAYRKNGTTLGYLGFSGVDNPVFINSAGGSRTLLHSTNYSSYALPLSGGVVKGVSPYHQYVIEIDTDNEFYSIYGIKNKGVRKGGLLWSKDSKHLIGVSIFNVTTGDYLGLSDAGSPMYNSNTLIHSGNIGSQRVSYASKTSSLVNNSSERKSVAYVSGNTFYIGDSIYAATSTQILGKDVRLRYGASATFGLILSETGNILIGITEDIGYKLAVNGTAKIAENVIIGASNQYNGRLKIVGVSGENVLFVANNFGASLFTVHNNGNVLIGTTTDNGYKLQVNGTFKANGLIIPTSAPTDLKSGDHALYLGSVGEGAELPSGVGGLDVAELWAELGKVDESKQINVSHIPTIEIARVSGLQTILNNKADASALSSYLLKSGGTISATSTRNFTIDRTNGSNSLIFFKGIVNGATNDLGYLGFNGIDSPIFYSAAGNTYPLFHTGNFNPADYLPKSGGTIKNGNAESPLKIDSNASQTYLTIANNSAGKSAFGWIGTQGTFLYSFAANKYLGIKDDGTPHYNGNTLIHSGNIGSQSVASANRLVTSDGKYIMYVTSTNNRLYIGDNINATTDTFILGKSIRMRYGSNGTRGFTLNSSGNVTIGASDLASTTTKLYVDGGIRFAPRTIWGQSFDGTGNVSGNLNLGYNKLYIGDGGNDYYIGWGAGNLYIYKNYFGHYFTTEDKERMRINRAGNVLIGTTTDNGSKLQVNGAMEATELVIPTAPPTNPQAGKHYLYLA